VRRDGASQRATRQAQLLAQRAISSQRRCEQGWQLIMVCSLSGANMPARHYSPYLTLALRGSAGSANDLVAHAERLALADLRTSLSIATLCRVMAVSERTLRKAFHKIHGLPPHRCLRTLKLSRARRELMLARGQSVTVTEIATDLGFVELGRFSVEYRRMFGESPSETLRQAFRDPGGGNSASNDLVAF
jgi:transcriptional regulator GlxA family with amidase domain